RRHTRFDCDWSSDVCSSDLGRNVVYAGVDGDIRQLYLRPLDRRDVAPIAGTIGALNPFFSPDGEWIGFFADGKLKKTRIGGGTRSEERRVGKEWRSRGWGWR